MRKLIFLSLLLVIGIQMGYRQDEDLPPYLYYYSDVLNAFAIERADGTDSRTMWREHTSGVRGIKDSPGFSPDGRWFAWTQPVRTVGEQVFLSPYVIHVETGTLVNMPSTSVAGSISWTPIEDTILITKSPDRTQSEQPPLTEYTLYDLSNSRIIWSHQFLNAETITSRTVGWSNEGQFAFAYWNYASDRGVWETFLVTIARDGVITERKLGDIYGILATTRHGWVIYMTERETLIALNAFTDDTFQLQIPDLYRQVEVNLPTYLQNRRNLSFTWNPTQEYAVVYEAHPHRSDRAYSPYYLWLFSTNERSLTLIDEEAYLNSAYFDPFSSNAEVYQEAVPWSWSSNGRYFVFQSEPSVVSLFDVAQGTWETIPVELAGDDFGRLRGAVRWSPDSTTLYFDSRWQPGHNVQIITYYIDSGETDIDPLLQYPIDQSGFSPSGHYLVVNGDFYDPAKVIDLTRGNVSSLPIHSSSTMGKQVFEWSSDEEWLVTGDSTCIAGGCPAYLGVGVTNREGTFWREMGVCFGLCVHWVPTQVDVTQLITGSAEAVRIEPTEIDYEVEFSPGSEDLTYQIACDEGAQTDLLILERESQEVLFQLDNGRNCVGSGGSVHFALSPDGRWLATSPTHASPMSFWNAETGELIAPLVGDTFELWFSDDGSRLYTRSRRAILVWDVNEILERAGMRESG